MSDREAVIELVQRLEILKRLSPNKIDIMATTVLYPHIQKIPDQAACLERIPRVRVAQIIMDYLAHGWSVEELCRHYPYLQPAEAHAAMAYYFDNREEIDHEIRTEWEQVQQEMAECSLSPFAIRMRAKGLL